MVSAFDTQTQKEADWRLTKAIVLSLSIVTEHPIMTHERLGHIQSAALWWRRLLKFGTNMASLRAQPQK